MPISIRNLKNRPPSALGPPTVRSHTGCVQKFSGIRGEMKDIIPDRGYPEKLPGNIAALLRRC